MDNLFFESGIYTGNEKKDIGSTFCILLYDRPQSPTANRVQETFGFFLYGIVCFIFTYLVLSVVIHFSACRFLVVQMPIGCDQMCVWADWTELCFFFLFLYLPKALSHCLCYCVSLSLRTGMFSFHPYVFGCHLAKASIFVSSRNKTACWLNVQHVH